MLALLQSAHGQSSTEEDGALHASALNLPVFLRALLLSFALSSSICIFQRCPYSQSVLQEALDCSGKGLYAAACPVSQPGHGF